MTAPASKSARPVVHHVRDVYVPGAEPGTGTWAKVCTCRRGDCAAVKR